MFGRRVPLKYVLLFSIIAALLCAGFAVYAGLRQSYVTAGVLAVLAVWFTVDALRARSWQQK